jgi:glucosamine--fructose-6-phosphate aminotransferase (isomerizing)
VCGIVGYVGEQDATAIIIEGLRRLEYRGYDSAGLAVKQDGKLALRKKAGKLSNLVASLEASPLRGNFGIGHTRWATHGRPSDVNAHPHADESGALVLIHNGIIENYLELKRGLDARGRKFTSETDTEVLAQLIAEKYAELGNGAQGSGRDSRLAAAVRAALAEVEGAYAIVVAHRDHEEFVAVRTISPLVIGLGQGENFLASDVPALLPHTRDVIFMHDGDLAIVRRDSVTLTDLSGNPVDRPPQRIEWNLVQAEKGGYDHFMLKEIFEQPATLNQTLGGRLDEPAGGVSLDLRIDPSGIDRVVLVAMGTAGYAATFGKYVIERFARIPCEADLAAEFRYRQPVIAPGTLVVAVSQSGETIDTLHAVREARSRGARLLAVANVMGSSLTREVDDTLYMHAGPEIGVASTKVYLAMLASMLLLGIWLGRARGTLPSAEAVELMTLMRRLPRLVEETLGRAPAIDALAQRFVKATDFLYLARGVNLATAFEGALKLKEISYIHAEAYATGEMKHGPIALIDSSMPVVIVATESELYSKTVSNLQEVRARQGIVIALATDGDQRLPELADHVIWVPRTAELLSPIVNVVPLQLLAYYIAKRRGADVDQPRNLAKSVTVE